MKAGFKAAALFARDGLDVIMLCRGMTTDQQPYYAFVKVKPSHLSAFEFVQQQGEPFSIQDYGEVLAYDFLAVPPPEVIAQMRARFGNAF